MARFIPTTQPCLVTNALFLVSTVTDRSFSTPNLGSSAKTPSQPPSSNPCALDPARWRNAALGNRVFTHKGIHTVHRLATDSQHIYRVGRDVQMAWVLDDSLGEVEGIYERYVNGALDTTGPYQLTMISNDVFAINRTMAASVEQELQNLKARFDALTTNYFFFSGGRQKTIYLIIHTLLFYLISRFCK